MPAVASPALVSRPCPRCGAAVVGALECHRCGIVIATLGAPAKRLALVERGPHAVEGGALAPPGTPARDVEAGPVPPLDDACTRTQTLGRALVWIGLAAWTAAFARHSVASNYAGESFLHLVNLVFHEAGHVLCAPFGQFVTVAGGSILQVLVPLTCAAAFLRTRNQFGVTVGLWWAGQSLLDLAPYINDARALQLVLLGGRTGAEVEGHDWEYLLGTLGLLGHDQQLARLAHGLGLAVMVGALGLGAVVLARQWAGPATPVDR